MSCEEKARGLVGAARAVAASSAVPLAVTDTSLTWVLGRSKRFEFFVAVAAIGIAFLSETRAEDRAAIQEAVGQWDRQARAALENFLAVIAKSDFWNTDRLDAAAGTWVLRKTRRFGSADLSAAQRVGQLCLRISAIP